MDSRNRAVLFVVFAFLLTAAGPAFCGVKLRAYGTVQTSGNGILIGDTEYNYLDTGLLTVDPNVTTSLTTGPLVADSTQSSGPIGSSIYALAKAEVTSQAGAFHAYLQAQGSTYGAGAVSGSAYTFGEWDDSILVTSSTLAPGTLVQLTGTVVVEYDVTATAGTYWYLQVYTSVLPTFLVGSQTPNASHQVTGSFYGVVGSTLNLFQTLNAQVQATALSNESLSGTLDVTHTVNLYIDAPAGVTLVSESGAAYAVVPEASSLLLVGASLAGAVAWSRRRKSD